MGGTHRYFGLSEIGFILLVAYILSRVRNRTVVAALTGIFILGNIITANRLLWAESQYRDAGRVNRFWTTIDASVGSVPKPVFVFSGEEPLRTYSLALSGSYPFAIARGITGKADIPVVTDDPGGLERRVCDYTMPLNYIFSFRVTNTGTLVDDSLPLRKAILIHAMDNGCVPTIILAK